MADHKLRLKTFGGLAIKRNGQGIAGLPLRKAEALLVYLACNPRVHPREVLAELLWDDRSQRQALAIDRERLANVALQGMLFPATGGMIPQGMVGYEPGINLPYDPQQARMLLAEAGFPDGRHFPHVHARTYPVDSFATISEWLQAQWCDVLNLNITFQAAEELDEEGNWLWLSGWVSGHTRDPGYCLEAYYVRGQHDAFDKLLREARQTLDPQARLERYRRADRLLIEEAIASPLLYGRAHGLVKPWVRGYLPAGMGVRWKELVIEPH